MKNTIKEIAITILFIIVATNVFNWLENENYKRVAKTCEKENIIIKYDNQGEKYYSCKVER